MPQKQEIPKLDLAAIGLPSDQITVGQMRRAQPDLFTQSRLAEIRGTDIGIANAMCLEEMLARKAYAAAAGLPDPYPDDDRLEVMLWLDDEYRPYGITSGLRQTHELVRRFEKAAAAQAKAALGQSR